jgi:uncharacterized protein (DUF1330 family)
MSAFWIARAKVTDPAAFSLYSAHVQSIASFFDYEIVMRSQTFQCLEGNPDFNRHVVLKFPDAAAALSYYASAQYQEAKELRKDGGLAEIVVAY